ncbi:uncharacterized protein ANIA_11270 [Aspergillus nidulans FGSC A4]|uniref:Uncharacterized protein n=1 Tax=Emericella nidulans (strain FGSC A4 / ATCC 38163 / CBS 112.46 / NRRL 194 / M139) TaxID=227321 RepID=C8VSW3_EMENI|nr:hypothetical protein [Aspergillus nidulans FGSC A4]CBF89334.1 TPA: hypothetical protein ANIA_11270 [Aspergillus nidulans FGSC A4]
MPKSRSLSFAYTRTLDLSDSAKACAVLKAIGRSI